MTAKRCTVDQCTLLFRFVNQTAGTTSFNICLTRQRLYSNSSISQFINNNYLQIAGAALFTGQMRISTGQQIVSKREIHGTKTKQQVC